MRAVGPVLYQVSQLDLSNVDLSAPSGRQLHRDYKWTLMLLLKLSAPVMVSIGYFFAVEGATASMHAISRGNEQAVLYSFTRVVRSTHRS